MISIIIPTFNEKNNLEELLSRVFRSSPAAEVIFVDDNSPDGTSSQIREMMKKYSAIKVLTRPAKSGLASAVMDGVKLAKHEVLCVMDADLSHPPEAIPAMEKIIRSGEAGIVVGSRLVPGGGSTHWPWHRKMISWAARSLAWPLTPVKDLTSGFFVLKKEVLKDVQLNPIGFKILLEILAKGNYRRAKEYPIIFTDRGKGKSKMGAKETLEYFKQLGLLYLDKIRRKH